MTPDDMQQVRVWSEGLTGPVTLGFVEGVGKQSLALEAFGRQLAAMSRHLLFKRLDRPQFPAPALAIGDGIFYQALPQGLELAPFLEALNPGHKTEPDPRLAALTLPAFICLYIAPPCPFCPTAVRQVLAVVRACHHLQVTVVDATLFPDQAAKDDVRSVPTLILEGQSRWVGQVPMDEVVDQLRQPDPFRLSAASLQRLLEEGQAQQVAVLMAQNGRLFPALTALLAHQRWSVRLGAMVAAETLAEMDQTLAARLQDPIWDVMDRADPSVQGDLLYVIGAIGGPEALVRLQAVVDRRQAGAVKEAALEAMDRIGRALRDPDICLDKSARNL